MNGSLNSDLKKYDAEQYEKEYDKSNVKIVQHIEGESFIDAYEVWLGNRNRAMIARSVFAKDRDRFDIYETEYYDYVQMDDAYITAVNTAFASEEYKLEYNTSSVPYTSKNVNVTVPGDTSGATTSGTLDGVTVITISTDSPKASVSHSGTNGAITDNVDYDDERDVNTYTKNRQITLDSEVEDILTNYAPSSLETYLDRINAYNREVGTYKEVFDRISQYTEYTQQDVDEWNAAVEGYNELTQPDNTFSITYDRSEGMNRRLMRMKTDFRILLTIQSAGD